MFDEGLIEILGGGERRGATESQGKQIARTMTYNEEFQIDLKHRSTDS